MIPPEAIALILESEGLDQPGRWPGGESGITLGHGYDLGYATREELARDWSPHLSPRDLARLQLVRGRRGTRAQVIAKSLRDIRITPKAARSVFEKATIPKWERITTEAFPGVLLLPALAFGALVSLTFNRGPSLIGDRRREMRSIREAIHFWSDAAESDRAAHLRPLLLTIAAQIRAMKRLWIGKGLDGLLIRREAEAKMIEKGAPAVSGI